ncbi:MAG: hypothetical protein ACRCXD_08080 [Luteolibacter sp.]
MNNVINNRIDNFRARLAVLDTPSNILVWNGMAPLKFTEKVTAARSLTATLVELAGRQTATTVGHAQDKRREEKELEDEAHKLGRALVNYCKDTDDLATAAKYDFQISGWRRLRDEVLLNKARLLATDAALFATGSTATAAGGYGITPAAIAKLTKEAVDYEKVITAPVNAIGERSTFTAELLPKSREIAELFDQLDDLAIQFRGTPEGDAFVATWLASGQIIDRGRGPGAEGTPPEPAPPVA